MLINFFNIEDCIFMKNIDFIHRKYFSIFQEWASSKATGDINKVKNLKIKLLNLIDESDLKEIEKFYNKKICLKKIENNIVNNFNSLNEANLKDYLNFCLFKNKTQVFLTCWR
jgi:hypothetical protein